MFVDRIREMVSFEISKEIEKDFLFVPQDEKHPSIFLHRAQNLPSLIFYILLSF